MASALRDSIARWQVVGDAVRRALGSPSAGPALSFDSGTRATGGRRRHALCTDASVSGRQLLRQLRTAKSTRSRHDERQTFKWTKPMEASGDSAVETPRGRNGLGGGRTP